MDIPNQITSTKTLYLPRNTMIWTDNIIGINIQDCNSYMERYSTYRLNSIREGKNNTFLEYYDGESIIEIAKTELDFFIELNIINTY